MNAGHMYANLSHVFVARLIKYVAYYRSHRENHDRIAHIPSSRPNFSQIVLRGTTCGVAPTIYLIYQIGHVMPWCGRYQIGAHA